MNAPQETSSHRDVLVIGAGLAGLTAAWRAAGRGRRVRLIAKGWGALYWHAGCVDVLGYDPAAAETPVESPAEGVARLIARNPRHPYALAGLDTVAAALDAFRNLCTTAGYSLHGSLERNWLLPSAVGALRPTCLAPESMIAGDLRRKEPMLLVGIRQLEDFYAELAADNLAAQGIPARGVMVDVPSLQMLRFVNHANLARTFDRRPEARAELADVIRPHLGDAVRVGVPAVLGLSPAMAAWRDLEAQLGRPIFEIPTLPASIAGIRLHGLLLKAIEQMGGRVEEGMEVTAADVAEGRVMAVWSEAAARRRRHRAEQFILATGGILGGGIKTDYQGGAREVVFDLPVAAPAARGEWFRREFLDADGHPIYRAGLTVDEKLRPVNRDGQVVYENVMAAGTTLAHGDYLQERSFDGVALVTGYMAGESI